MDGDFSLLDPSLPLYVGPDGSGGPSGKDPRLCKCGWSIVVGQCHQNQLIVVGAMSGNLTDDGPNTVPRAELHAFVHGLEILSQVEAPTMFLSTDSAYVFKNGESDSRPPPFPMATSNFVAKR